MKYKVGDKVKVRKDLKLNREYKMFNSAVWDDVTDGMMLLKGKLVTVDGIGRRGYLIKEDECHYNWTDEMFESEVK